MKTDKCCGCKQRNKKRHHQHQGRLQGQQHPHQIPKQPHPQKDIKNSLNYTETFDSISQFFSSDHKSHLIARICKH